MKVGDRVEVINKFYTNDNCGRTGVIIQIDGSSEYSCAYLRMDDNKRLYDCCTAHLKVIVAKDVRVKDIQTDLFSNYSQGVA